MVAPVQKGSANSISPYRLTCLPPSIAAAPCPVPCSPVSEGKSPLGCPPKAPCPVSPSILQAYGEARARTSVWVHSHMLLLTSQSEDYTSNNCCLLLIRCFGLYHHRPAQLCVCLDACCCPVHCYEEAGCNAVAKYQQALQRSTLARCARGGERPTRSQARVRACS